MISPDLPMMAVIWEYVPPLKALTRQLGSMTPAFSQSWKVFGAL